MTLETYHIVFTIFLTITIILGIVLTVFFFLFDIRKIIYIKTGRALRQTVKNLNDDMEIRQKGEKTIALSANHDAALQNTQNITSDSNERFFKIGQTKMVMYSNEIIPKK